MPAASSFGELLKDLRRQAGYSQEALAEHAGLSVGAIAALEQGWRRAPYRATVDALATALGVSKGARRELEELAARARGRISREAPSLPMPLSSFVDRIEVEEALKLLESFRLVTVTGTPGVGKTRLALEVAARSGSLFEDIWYVDLLPVRNGSLVVMQIAGAMDVSLEETDDLLAIVRRLRSRKTLMVIDNCEHVIGDAAAAVTKLLQRCSSLSVLTTSREALAVSGEVLFRLPPLNHAAAAELFIERGRIAGRALVLDDRRRAIVAEICTELQGIPLAIELAASRVSALGFEDLRKRLRIGITLTGGRDMPVHQQTVNATIAWSYDLLSPPDQSIFANLSIFAAGFTLEMAEGVFADACLLPGTIADGIARLLQKSLLEFEEDGSSSRYRFLDSIRTFASERLLDGGGPDNAMLRLIHWVTRTAKPLEAGYSLDLVKRLKFERDNINAAVTWAIAKGQYSAIEAAARLLYAVRLVFRDATRQLDFAKLGFIVLQNLSDERSPESSGLLISALLPYVTDDEELARLAPRAIRLLNATGHEDRGAVLYTRFAISACRRGDRSAAEAALADAAAAVSQEQPGSRSRFIVEVASAYVYALLKDFARGRAALENLRMPSDGDHYEIEARIVLAEIEFRQLEVQKAADTLASIATLGLERYPTAQTLIMQVYGNLAKCELLLEHAEAAETHIRHALLQVLDTRDKSLSVFELSRYAAWVASNRGDYELAARLIGACQTVRNPKSLEEDNDHATAPTMAAVAARVSPERVAFLRESGAGEDLFDLIEEFLARPVAPV